MRIRTKVLMVVLPLLVFPLFLIGYTSFLSARSGITKIAEEFLKYKTVEMFKFCRRQEDILTDAGLDSSEEYRRIAQQSAEDYANSIRLSETGYFTAVDSSGTVVFPKENAVKDETGRREGSAGGASENLTGAPFFENMKEKKVGFLAFVYKGAPRVGYYVYFPDWDWFILLSEREKTFFQDAEDIKRQVAFTLGVTFVFATGLILFFIKKLTDPVANVVSTMREIITNNDLSKRVRVEYDDEIGSLATTFNRMVEDLELAYNDMYQLAQERAAAFKNEKYTREIFQKYVPAEVVEEVLKTGGKQLMPGKRQVTTILFTDIRGFTSISEKTEPDTLIKMLNAYYDMLVDVVVAQKGEVDKYVGDAIMAVFGMHKRQTDDSLRACVAGLRMLDTVKVFNKRQSMQGRSLFPTGIGLATGEVIIGDIGAVQKRSYTCIGDPVNLASRLEGMTKDKEFGVPIIISEDTYREARGGIVARELGQVRVTGKARAVTIFEPYTNLTARMKEGYEAFGEGLKNYRNRDFLKAKKLFGDAKGVLGKDGPSTRYMDWCEEHIKNPPGENWDGVYDAKTK